MNNTTIRNIVIVIIILAIGAVAAYFQFSGSENTSQEVTPTAVTDTTNNGNNGNNVNNIAVDTGVERVSAEGVIKPQTTTSLSFNSNGFVTERFVSLGEVIEAGDPLLQLDTASLTLAVNTAEIGLNQAQANLEKAEIGVTLAQAQVNAAQTRYESALIGVSAAEAQLSLATSAPISEELDALQANIDAATATINQASASRELAIAGPTQAQIDAAEAQLALAQAEELALQIQYDELIRNNIGGPPEETLRFSLFASEANLTAAQTRLNELLAGPSNAERQVAQANVSIAIAQRSIAEAQLALALADPKNEELLINEISILQAEANVAQALVDVTQAEVLLLQAEATVEEAQLAVTAAETNLQSAQLALADMTLTSPVTGRVVQIDTNVGEFVTAATPVIVIASQGNWIVETTDLTEFDVVNIAVGYPVDVYIDAIPDTVVQGTVQDISSTPTLLQGDVTYAVKIQLTDTSDLPLRWGMTVSIDIQTD